MSTITSIIVAIDVTEKGPDAPVIVRDNETYPVDHVLWEAHDFGIEVTAFPEDITTNRVCESYGAYLELDEAVLPDWIPVPPAWFAEAAKGVVA